MAIAATAVVECRSTATAGNANGGLFVDGVGRTDYSQQDSAQYNLTGLSTAGASAVIATASAAADMLGNGAKVVSGTNATVGWYEITAVNPGVDITLDRNWCTGAVANGVVNIGGAMSLGGTGTSSDDALFETLVAGNKVWIKNGTYTLGAAIALGTAVGTTANRIVFEGYNSTREDKPTGSTRPTIATGSFAITLGAYTDIKHVNITGSATTQLITMGTGGRVLFCRLLNTTTTTTAYALSTPWIVVCCEIICLRGRGSYSNNTTFIGCYIHDSNDAVFQGGNSGVTAINCIFASNVSNAFNQNTGAGFHHFINCTFYGSSAKIGTAWTAPTGSLYHRLVNSIVTGFVTGLSHADAGYANNYSDFNSYYNNTTDVSNMVKGTNDIALNPAFASVTEITGTNGTTSGAVLTSSGANFSSVVDNVDFCHIISGTGVTAGKYQITSHTTDTLTLSPSPGTDGTADKVFSISCGHDFRVGANMANVGAPGLLPGGLCQSYLDIGAVQRKPATIVSGRIG